MVLIFSAQPALAGFYDVCARILALGGQNQAAVRPELTIADKAVLIWGELEVFWQRELESRGYSFKPNKLVLLKYGALADKGQFIGVLDGPKYVFSEGKTYFAPSYIEDVERDLGAKGEAWLFHILSHEYGHHIQNLLGLHGARKALEQGASKLVLGRLSVLSELSAEGLAGYSFNHIYRRGDADDQDLADIQHLVYSMGNDVRYRRRWPSRPPPNPDNYTHGSGEQRRAWFNKGRLAASLEDINPFVDPTLHVGEIAEGHGDLGHLWSLRRKN